MKELARITATSYARPYRPWLLRAANALGRVLGWVGIRPRLDPESLVTAARRRNRLEDFGEPAVEERLARLVASIDEEARLHPLGRLITRERLLGVLGNRLRAQQLFAAHPEILRLEVAPPIVITGLQRTGTTLLHRLLAADPETRSLGSWEAINPAPFLPWGPSGPDRRVALARRSERALAYMAPDFFAIHPVEADAPEEDSILLDFSFLSPVAEATLRVPSYSRWLAGQSMTPAYRYLENLLRLLQWQKPARRWVLKSPAHLPFLDVLLAVFPRARIIHTHRDPRVTLASYCSMIAHGRGVFSDAIDPVELGGELLAQQSGMLLAAMRHRERAALDAAVLDVYYDELVASPLEQIERIYDFVRVPLSTAARDAMEASLRVNRQHRYGKHRYSLADFGLRDEQMGRAFAAYEERHAAGGRRAV